jgi:excisionase family DNA binding protein
MRLLTVPEAARRLDRNPELIRRWIRERRLGAEKFGRDWLVSERELERFRRVEPQRRRR